MADVDSQKQHVDLGDVGLALLGFASGSMDALAFFNLGEVFPSAMTGNTALLGLVLGLEHAQKLIQAKDPQEILAHQSEYVKKQLAAMEEHAKELGTAVLKAVTPDK
jgi:hypothetical protein